jgi:hypothetical protein
VDNLVHARSQVKAPWAEFRAQGDSLFLWQVVYSLIVFVVMGTLAVATFLVFIPVLASDSPALAVLPLVVLAGAVGFVLIVTLIYVEFFLIQFVVPLMYRHRISTTAAWRRFLPLFREHPGGFVVFGLLYLFIMLVGWILFFVGGVATCCIGLVLLVLPYIGTVITLPLHTLGRYLSLEYLGGYGEDFSLLAAWPETPEHPYGSGEVQGNGAVVGPENVGEDSRPDETGPERP